MSDAALNGLLDHLLAQASGDDPSKHTFPKKHHPLAQAMELDLRYGQMTENRPAFAPGTLVRERKGLGILRDEMQAVLVVVRTLDPTSAYDWALLTSYIAEHGVKLAAGQPDLVLASLCFANMEAVSYCLSQSCMIEQVTHAMLTDWTGSRAEATPAEASDV